MSQTLVRAGLIVVEGSEDGPFARFTEAGKAAALSLGIEV